MHGNMSKV